MHADVVKNWFGEKFQDLHPLLQKLHLTGGQLSGDVRISFGKGISGVIGRRLAKKMQFPGPGTHQLKINISHSTNGLSWGRSFNSQAPVTSLFKPIGNIDSGYWIESTGPLKMKLTIDIINGGWFWHCLSVNFFGIPVPIGGACLFFLRCGDYRVRQARPNNWLNPLAPLTGTG